MKRAYLGIDLGTTAVKCLAIDNQGKCLSQGEGRYPLYAERPGWVEQKPEEWMQPVYSAIRFCIERLDNYKPEAVSFSGHMSSIVFLDENTKPLLPCMLVGDTRASDIAESLYTEFGEEYKNATGNVPWSGFIAPRILWLMKERPDIYKDVNVFIMAKDYIRYRLTGELCTDYTDAGNTLLLDLETKDWNYELIKKSGLNSRIFPKIVSPSGFAGKITDEASAQTGLPEGLPVICGAADMACSQIGTGGLRSKRLIITLSTSGQVCLCVENPSPNAFGKLTFHPGVDSMYAMASIISGGLAVNWGFNLLSGANTGDVPDFRALDILAEDIKNYKPGQSNIMFLPFLTGSGSPHNLPDDRSSLVGLSLSSDKKDIVHAIMEGVAFNIRENVDVFKKLGSWDEVRLGGGGVKMEVWSHMIADVLGQNLDILNTSNASAMGACALAAIGIGDIQSLPDLSEKISVCNKIIECDRENADMYNQIYKRYCHIYDVLK